VTIEVLKLPGCGLSTTKGGVIVVVVDYDCRASIENLIVACQLLLEYFEQFGYAKDPEFFKGVSFLMWHLNAEIDFLRWVSEGRMQGKEVSR
jgi:hypothetical protein